jgi:hypothetical protein
MARSRGLGDVYKRQVIAIIDSFTSGMPVTPNGGDINVILAAAGILQLY